MIFKNIHYNFLHSSTAYGGYGNSMEDKGETWVNAMRKGPAQSNDDRDHDPTGVIQPTPQSRVGSG